MGTVRLSRSDECIRHGIYRNVTCSLYPRERSSLWDPKAYSRLQQEVDAVFPREAGDPFDAYKLEKNMPYLNAVM